MSQFSVKGFAAAGISAGIKKNNAKDLAIIASDTPCNWAGVFTTNQVKAACVTRSQFLLQKGTPARAVVINSGNANAYTGELGASNDHRVASLLAAQLNTQDEEILTLSTGVIGVQLPMHKFEQAMPQAIAVLHSDGWSAAASAIMTTDTYAKLASAERNDRYKISGMAKGAGMIAPNMATMLSVIVTDAVIGQADLQHILHRVAEKSFNRIVVDGDMSTNDTLFLLANGASGVEPDRSLFEADLEEVAIELAQSIVRDGEGATKFVTIEIINATKEQDATDIARAIAMSPLCKTAFHGADPNWGRIIAAAGYAGVEFDPAKLSLWLLDADNKPAFHLVAQGVPQDFDEPASIKLMETDTWGFRLDMGQGGSEEATVWTCDLSHDYVTINGEYRT